MNANNQNVTFTMKFDPADLKTLASQISAIFGTGGGGGGGAGAGGGGGGSGGAMAGAAGGKAPGVAAMAAAVFAGQAALDAIKKGIEFIVRNSSVANTYLGAMGKVFGAAIDLILIPFTPIFNLILVGLAKLVEWLSKDEVQRFLEKIANTIMQGLTWLYGQLEKYLPVVVSEIMKVVEKIVEIAADIKRWVDRTDVPGRLEQGYKDTKETAEKAWNFGIFGSGPILKAVVEASIKNNPVVRGAMNIKDMITGDFGTQSIAKQVIPWPLNKVLSVPNVNFGNLYEDTIGSSNLSPSWLRNNDKWEEFKNNKNTMIVQQQPDVTMNFYNATDSKEAAEIFEKKMNEMGQRVTYR